MLCKLNWVITAIMYQEIRIPVCKFIEQNHTFFLKKNPNNSQILKQLVQLCSAMY